MRMANILVFDANPVSRRLVTALLRNHGNCVRDVGDADEALRLVRLEQPDLMIVDIATPDIDGCKLVVQMRRDPSLPQPRVLMRSCGPSAGAWRRCRAAKTSPRATTATYSP